MIELKKGTLKWNKKLTPISRDRFKTQKIPRRPKKIYPEGKPQAPAGGAPAAAAGNSCPATAGLSCPAAKDKLCNNTDKKEKQEGLWSYKF